MFELIFITSNKEKLAHARHLCRNYPVYISKKKNYGVGYLEPRIGDRRQLIKQSVEDAIDRFKKNVTKPEEKNFFIEDTSVILHGLSKSREYPGVDIKYWMKENNFQSLDEMLKKAGNDRTVTVRSDLILVLDSNLKEKYKSDYLVFTSSVQGTVVSKEINIKTQPLYPWLNNTTFNKWFVPINCKKPLSALPIKQADKFDFRAGAFKEMLSLFEENNYLKQTGKYQQLELFEPVIFIICGPTCAGKTTLSSYLQDSFHYYHIEASDFMYLSFHERHGIDSNVSIADFAEVALKENPGIVADQIIKNIKTLKRIPIAITGFRSHLEIESFKERYFGKLDVQVVYIDANEELRFARSVRRNRSDAQKTFTDFQNKDKQQYNMGLLKIKNLNEDSLIVNDTTFEVFYQSFEQRFEKQLKRVSSIKKNLISLPKGRNLENIIIQTLFEYNSERFYTTTEISHLITEKNNLIVKSKNNISRYFNQNYHPYFEITTNDDGTACYRLSQTGLAHAKWLKQHFTDQAR